MGGSSDVPEQKATPEEIERTKIAEEQWGFYEKYGKPVASKYVSAVTGFKVGEDGSLQVDSDSKVRNADGSIRTDASSAIAGTEAAFAPKMQGVNPNSGAYRGGLVDMEAAQMRSGAEADSGIRLAQQNRGLKGLENAIAMGRGEQTTAVKGLSELATTANQKAASDAQTAFQDQSADRYMLGQLAGAGVTYAGRKGVIPGLEGLKG